MEVKLIEIRDSATFIPAMAVKLTQRSDVEDWLLRRAGYDQYMIDPARVDIEPYVILWRLEGGPAEYDPYAWGNRTMAVAHKFLIEHWQEIQDGQVVDVQFILGETAQPKVSERLSQTNVVRDFNPEAGERIVP